MTVYNITESARAVFPEIGETQLVGMINKSQKEFAGKIGILKKAGQLTDPSTNITWTLPSDCKEVLDVTFYDSNDLPLAEEDLGISYEIVFGKITFVNRDGTKLTGLPSTVIYAYVDYVYYPATIDAVTDSLEIEEELHGAIEADLYEQLYARYPVDVMTRNGVVKTRDFNAVSYWRSKYKDYELEGKRLRNLNKDATSYSNTMRDKLGNPISVRRQRISATGTIPFSPLASLYSKYIRFTAVEGGSITIDEQFGWVNTIATPTETSYVLTILSSAEFTETMQPITSKAINNTFGASTWTYELYSGYGTMQFEIYER